MKKILVFFALAAIGFGANAQLKIGNGGNIGIGTNNPTHKLQVYGNSLFDGTTIFDGRAVFVHSNEPNYGRAISTTVYHQYTCAYHLVNPLYYGGDVFYIRGDGMVWTRYGYLTTSDSTLKTNIQVINSSLTKIKNLRGVTYNRIYQESDSLTVGNNSKSKLEPTEYGLIAQEVESVIPEVVHTMHDGTKAIAYQNIIPVLIEAIKEQQVLIESHQAQIENLQKTLSECCPSKNNTIQKSISPNNEIEETKNETPKGKLYDNVPNPFNVSTEIRFEIPNNAVSAQLMICNLNGVELKSYPLTQKGLGSIIIQGSELTAGIYLYTLLINNQIIDTKKMVLTK